jgi:hypothetical protein
MTNTTQKLRQVVLFLCAIAALYSVSGASAQDVPPYLVHQGRLLDALNAPVEGAQSLTFNLYAEETGGASLWTETQTVSVNAGFYSVTLGQATPLAVSAFNGDTLYLGVTIGGEELAPRLAMRSVPYALKAGAALNATGDLTPTSVTIGDVVIDASGVTIGGNNVIDGSGQWSGPAPTVSFNDLLDPPTTLSGLGCSDGEVAQVVGGAWACVPASSADTLSGLACADGQVAKRVGGAWACADDIDTDTDTDTIYTAGDGISLTAGAFSADATLQRRVNSTCTGAGESIKTINADGSVTCAVDTNTTYTAGSGISLTGGAFSADATVQRRTTAPTCPAGQYLRAIAADGSPTCVADADTNTTYTAASGSGVTLVGGAFGTDATIQRRTATPTCPAGQYLRTIAADGTPTCAPDTDTTYTAGSGISLTGGAFSTDATVQRRTATPTCPAGQYLRALAADGTPTCALDIDTDTNTTYTAASGSGVTLVGGAFGTDATVQRRTVAPTCPAGQYLRTIAADGTPTCAPDIDTDTTYGAAVNGGLALTGPDFSIAAGGVTTARLADGAVTNVKIAANAVNSAQIINGTIVAADTDTASVQSRVTGTCAVGQTITAINANGTVTCGNAPLGESQTNPATSCNALLTARPGLASGVYWLKPSSSSTSFQTYCDMVTDGGGWTLVWSNLRGGRGKLTTEMQWNAAINTVTKVRGQLSTDTESFEVYTGLKHWTPLAPSGLIRYTWSPNYNTAPTQSWRARFTFNAAANYTISLSASTQLVGAVTPGLLTLHNNRPFSAYDAGPNTGCANNYSETPWWYESCWSGSISGGGEYSETGYFNGAYWTGSATAWGTADGNGAGNGWIFVK